MLTDAGFLGVEVPRARKATFEPHPDKRLRQIRHCMGSDHLSQVPMAADLHRACWMKMLQCRRCGKFWGKRLSPNCTVFASRLCPSYALFQVILLCCKTALERFAKSLSNEVMSGKGISGRGHWQDSVEEEGRGARTAMRSRQVNTREQHRNGQKKEDQSG